ncbi:MAG: hypothetical protein JXR83_06860 [Deltaproteobacteria bacterium]|nr:hypothetical protein [Deltaproteobacteria bacterium]
MRKSASPLLLALLIGNLLARCTCSSEPEPIALNTIAPASARSGESVAVVISGSGFAAHVVVSYQSTRRTTVDDQFSAWLGQHALEQVRHVDSQNLTAVVPPTLPVGSHELIVESPAGERVTLAAAFEVLPVGIVDAGPTEGGIPDRAAADLPGDRVPLDRPAQDRMAADSTHDTASAFDTGAVDVQPADVALTDTATTDAGQRDAGSSTGAGRLAIAMGAATTATLAVDLAIEAPGNLVATPDQLGNWTIIDNFGDGWATCGTTLFGDPSFCTSFDWNTRSRILDLVALGISAAELDAQPPIAVYEWVTGYSLRGPADFEDFYYVRSDLRRQRNGGTAVTFNRGSRQNPARSTATWQPVGTTFTGYGPGVRFVYLEDGGHDVEFWAGPYGAYFTSFFVHVGAIEMRLANDGAGWSDWQPFTPTAPWMLEPASSGLHIVHVEFRDGSGALLGSTSDTIDVDLP